ncbi:GTPase IMAP member 4 [Bulinus truncatus]|nr:GTPase IMAP member 4 [Bulinus truncatus]
MSLQYNYEESDSTEEGELSEILGRMYCSASGSNAFSFSTSDEGFFSKSPYISDEIHGSKIIDKSPVYKLGQSDIHYISQHAAKKELNTSKSVHEKSGPDIDLLMIGKTGNGQSALGNTILRRTAFNSRPSLRSVTKEVTYEVTEYQGRKIKVVDVPGVGYTDDSNDSTEVFLADKLADAIAINPRGYHAFLLVVKYGGRFTIEDSGIVEYLKKIFVELVQECSHRTILFDNKTTDEAKRSKQLNDLIEMVDSLMIENCRYTNEQFEIARTERDAFIINCKEPYITEEAIIECSIILQLFHQGLGKLSNYSDTSYLKELLHRADKLYDMLVKKDNETKALNFAISHVHALRKSIFEEITLSLKKAELEELQRTINEKMVKEENKAAEFEHELHSQWTEERKMYREELTRILDKTRKLEEENKTLRKKDTDLFAAIKHKVAKTFKRKEKIPTEDKI